MIPDVTPNSQKFHALAGTGARMMEVDANGNVTATEAIITAKLDNATTKALLSDTGNWSGKAYAGTAITGTYEGMYYADSDYFYFFYADNLPIRMALV